MSRAPETDIDRVLEDTLGALKTDGSDSLASLIILVTAPSWKGRNSNRKGGQNESYSHNASGNCQLRAGGLFIKFNYKNGALSSSQCSGPYADAVSVADAESKSDRNADAGAGTQSVSDTIQLSVTEYERASCS